MSKGKWSSTTITTEIRREYRRHGDISYCAMCRRRQALVSAANYHFGSYRRAVEAAGLDYTSLRLKPRWTRDRILAVIRRAARRGRDLRWSVVSIGRDELAQAAKAAIRPRLFGGWRKALKSAGLVPMAVCAYRAWPADEVIRELRRRRRRHAANSAAIQREVPGLYRAAVRHFGSFAKALCAAGIDLAQISHRREWNPHLVRKTLRELKARNGNLNANILRTIDSGALRAARIHFGSFQRAMQSC